MTAEEIIEALIAVSSDKIWARELACFGGDRRVDFWTLEPAASKGFRATSYEIKISVADFRRDSEEKQAGALLWSDRFWYVTPPDLVDKASVPTWAGLMEWDGKMFHPRKRAPKREKAEPSWDFVVSLLRNSRDGRRDVEVIKEQMNIYKRYYERSERIGKMRSDIANTRWLARYEKMAASGTNRAQI